MWSIWQNLTIVDLIKPRYKFDCNYHHYQSVFIGGEYYTPQLRNRDVFTKPNSYDGLDRTYCGLSIYWIWQVFYSPKRRYKGYAQEMNIGQSREADRRSFRNHSCTGI